MSSAPANKTAPTRRRSRTPRCHSSASSTAVIQVRPLRLSPQDGAKMSTLLFVIFAIELLAHVINAIGAAQINNLVRAPNPATLAGSDRKPER